MHPNPRKIAPVIVFVGLIAAILYYLVNVSGTQAKGPLTASGTVEVVEIRLAAEISGRVVEVLVEEGQAVTAGQALVRLDDSLLQAQRQQAQAAMQVALANFELVSAGQPAEQQAAAVAGAEFEVLAAQQSLDTLLANVDLAAAQRLASLAAALQAAEDAQAGLDALPNDPDALDRAQLEAALALALAQLAKVRADQIASGEGPDPQALALAEARLAAAQARLAAAGLESPTAEQVAVAQAQAVAARTAIGVIETQIAKTVLTAPIDGVILERLAEPGELALPNATLVVLADLDALTLTVYAPEDRYGEIELGQSVQVSVDSFPDETFEATVVHIAAQAEFTPRNVQTQEGRRLTVFAIRLALEDSGGKLKPGMPADVVFGEED